jgi:hypothetical protein
MHTEAVPVISENGGMADEPDQPDSGKQTLTTGSAPVVTFYRAYFGESIR